MPDDHDPAAGKTPGVPGRSPSADPGAGHVPGDGPGTVAGRKANSDPAAPRPDSAVEAEIEAELEEAHGRREFLQKAGSIVVGGAIVAGPAAVGIVAVSDPVRRATRGGVMARLTPVDALPEDGTPQIFKVVADKVDAWTTHKNLPLGLVYASRRPDGSVVVFSASCPHAGCAVEYRKDDEIGAHYYCPCHESWFAIDGAIGNDDSPSRRGLDTLELDEEKLADGEVWVRFQRFKAGVAEKKPVS